MCLRIVRCRISLHPSTNLFTVLEILRNSGIKTIGTSCMILLISIVALVLRVVFCLVRQAQFYLGFPVLLLLLRPAVRGLFRRMAVTAVIVIAAVTAYRAVIALQFELPVPVFGPLDDPRMLELMTRTLRLGVPPR